MGGLDSNLPEVDRLGNGMNQVDGVILLTNVSMMAFNCMSGDIENNADVFRRFTGGAPLQDLAFTRRKTGALN